MSDHPTPSAPVNRYAAISLIAGGLSVASLCTAVAPIPFTGYVCYPAALLLGLAALLSGVTSLMQLRARPENGRLYAVVGVSIGAITVLAAFCAAAVGVMVFPRVAGLLHQYVR